MIQITNLTKQYGSKIALNNVTLGLEAGKVIGLFGENGCGKTTLLRILAGLNQPTSGTVTIAGSAPGPATKAIVSYMPDSSNFPGSRTVNYLMSYFGDFFADFARGKCEALLQKFSIDPGSKISELSKGQREKVQVALTMARNARVYLIDEPISGVDPLARQTTLEAIVASMSEEATLVITTHMISEIEPLLDEVVMLRGGNLLGHHTVDSIREAQGLSLNEYFKAVYA